MVTRKEVAQLAGVSEATVSRILNGVGPFKEETKEKVLQAARELQYYPNAIARSFARGKSGNLGVVLPYLPKVHVFSTYYFSEILSGIGEAVREQGYNLLLLFSEPGKAGDLPSLYWTQKVDACVILGASDHPEELGEYRKLAEANMPFCLVNQHYEGEGFQEVDADHRSGSYHAVRHLIECGHSRIAFLNGPDYYSNSRDRLAGYLQAMEEAGLPVPEGGIIPGEYSRKSGYQAAAAVARLKGSIDAVFAANDRMAIGLMQGLREYGIVPGKDLAIVGYDDSDAATLTDPPLTSVHVPFFDMGRLAASRLLKQLVDGSGDGGYRKILPTDLVLRKSCMFRATND